MNEGKNFHHELENAEFGFRLRSGNIHCLELADHS